MKIRKERKKMNVRKKMKARKARKNGRHLRSKGKNARRHV